MKVFLIESVFRAFAAMLRRFRVILVYLWRFRRWPDLSDPRRFTEWVQRRKLHDRDPRLPRLTDKVAVKDWVSERLGPDWVTPTLWSGRSLPRVADWPRPFVIKARHGCGQNIFVRAEGDCAHEDAATWQAHRATAAAWLKRAYGVWLDEWGYRDVPRGLLVEPFVGTAGALPVDYKFYVFGGRVRYVQVHLDREHDHRWHVFGPDWSPRFATDPAAVAAPRPASLSRMLAAAETLGADFDFVRVDLYEVGGVPRFGEMAFYPGSGLDPFDPPELDFEMGAFWARARAAAVPARLGWRHPVGIDDALGI